MKCETTSNASTPSSVRPREILLVDDDPALLDVLPQTIEGRVRQVTITACDSAEAALAHIATGKYDLVITDLNMPGMKGLEFIRRVKSTSTKTPVLVITGHGDERAKEEALRAGAQGFIPKPFDGSHVIESLSRSFKTRDALPPKHHTFPRTMAAFSFLLLDKILPNP